MSESVHRRSLLKLAAGATGAVSAGWLWQASPVHADESTLATADGTQSVGALDTVVFGDTASESAHKLTANLSDVVSGGLGQSGRVLNPQEATNFWGGALAVTMACRPKGPTYVTIKLWGSEAGEDLGRLQLYAEGKQVGHMHLGPVDPLDIAGDDPRTLGRFYFHTLPLPPELTAGKESVSLEVRSMGWLPPYAATAADYYKPMTRSTRGIYRLYTHDAPHFVLTAGDITGTLGVPAVRTSPGSEVIDAIQARVAKQVDTEVAKAAGGMLQGGLQFLDFLARAYAVPGTSAYDNPVVVNQVLQSLDDLYWRYIKDPEGIIQSGQDWLMGIGRIGRIILQLRDELDPHFDEPVVGSPGTVANPGFEYGTTSPTGWRSATWNGAGTTARDTTVSRSGTASAKVTIPSSGVVGWVPNAKTKVGQGTYTYETWIKTDGVDDSSAYLDVLFFDDTMKVVGHDNKFYAAGGTHDWEHVTATMVTPATATSIELHLRLQGAGTAWFDDVALTAPADSPITPVIRRDAWAKMLLASREYWRQNIGWYTNQTQICCIGLYLADRGLEVLGSKDAWGEKKARGYIYQAVGLSPFLGDEDAAGNPTKPLGSSYHVVTKKGLSKELGYTGSYGELQSWLTLIYEIVTVYGGVKDDTLRDHLIKMVKTRAVFHHPSVDADGCRTMRYEAVIGWRDPLYPGRGAYDQDVRWEGHPMQFAALVKDPDVLGYAHQMMDDNQLFNLLNDALSLTSGGATYLNLLTTAGDYAIVTSTPGSGVRLPMTPGQPDFVFSDEENGVVAVKHGEEILYASLYWRARWGVNRLARIHHIAANGIEHSATVWQDAKYIPDGRAATEPDWVNWDFQNPGGIPGGWAPPGDTLHQAFAGQVLPLAAAPADAREFAVGEESPFAGRAAFYRCEYGPYLIAMNTSRDRTYTFSTKGFGASVDLASGAKVEGNAELRVKPGSTTVLYKR